MEYNKKKRKILISIAYFLPGYKMGGPQKSIIGIIKYLNEEFDFYVVCKNKDFGDKESYENIPVFQWIQRDGYKILYYDKYNLPKLAKSIREEDYDIIFLNSFFAFTTYIFLILKMFFGVKGHKVLIAPRGELFEAALRIKSIKKSIFIFIVKFLGIIKDITWLATNTFEKDAIQSIFGKVDVKVALNIPQGNFDKILKKSSNQDKHLKIVFLSRIVQIKNLDYALDILSKVSSEIPIDFDIYGNLEDMKFWNKCLTKIERLKENIHVLYKGSVDPSSVEEVFENYQIFLFPTQSENFGHVIFEALSVGLITIISDQTPWKNLENFDAGWALPLDNMKGFVTRIEELAEMDVEQRDRMRQGAKNFATHIFKTQDSISQTRALFLSMLQGSSEVSSELELRSTFGHS